MWLLALALGCGPALVGGQWRLLDPLPGPEQDAQPDGCDLAFYIPAPQSLGVDGIEWTERCGRVDLPTDVEEVDRLQRLYRVDGPAGPALWLPRSVDGPLFELQVGRDGDTFEAAAALGMVRTVRGWTVTMD